jgi:molybdopterin/thiamine biosynthesis adenylyltransferase
MAHVVVVGAGGNIGSHLVPHLGRTPLVSRVTLIDRDRYEPGNLRAQAIDRGEVGKPKVIVQAGRLRKINPALEVTTLHRAVEDVPLGLLRADAIAACLDSRRARLVVNQAAWRLGVPWINAGVDGGGLLARVQAFVPSPDAPCLECAWDQSDYDAVEQNYPCQVAAGPAPSGAPSSLGALAAALQAMECDKLLGDDRDNALISRDLLVDARHHRHFVTTFRRNAACRMPDHAGWRINPLDGTAGGITLRDLFALGSILRGADEQLTFRVAGQRLVIGLTCLGCGVAQPALALERSLRHKALTCPHCKGRLRPLGFDLTDAAPLSDSHATMDWALSRIGIRMGDVISLVTPSVDAHYQIGGTP